MTDVAKPQNAPRRTGVRGGMLAMAALLAAGIGGERGPRSIGKRTFLTGIRSGRRRREWKELGLGQRARIAAQIAKEMLRVETPERLARWLDVRLQIAAGRSSMDPGQPNPPSGHTTKSARRNEARREAARRS